MQRYKKFRCKPSLFKFYLGFIWNVKMSNETKMRIKSHRHHTLTHSRPHITICRCALTRNLYRYIVYIKFIYIKIYINSIIEYRVRVTCDLPNVSAWGRECVRARRLTQNFLSLSHFFPRYAGISHTSILISLPISIIVELKTKWVWIVTRYLSGWQSLQALLDGV